MQPSGSRALTVSDDLYPPMGSDDPAVSQALIGKGISIVVSNICNRHGR
jgi:hypothetical protein